MVRCAATQARTCAISYLTAWVLEYGELRTFALERIRTLGVRDDQFEPRALPPEPFANSLGVFSGSPELVEIQFDACADYVRGREWHRSQEVIDAGDGSIVLRLCVTDDRALRAWILSFGASAQVLAPASLARAIYEEIQAAGEKYARPRFEMLRMPGPSRLVQSRFDRLRHAKSPRYGSSA